MFPQSDSNPVPQYLNVAEPSIYISLCPNRNDSVHKYYVSKLAYLPHLKILKLGFNKSKLMYQLQNGDKK